MALVRLAGEASLFYRAWSQSKSRVHWLKNAQVRANVERFAQSAMISGTTQSKLCYNPGALRSGRSDDSHGLLALQSIVIAGAADWNVMTLP